MKRCSMYFVAERQVRATRVLVLHAFIAAAAAAAAAASEMYPEEAPTRTDFETMPLEEVQG